MKAGTRVSQYTPTTQCIRKAVFKDEMQKNFHEIVRVDLTGTIFVDDPTHEKIPRGTAHKL